VSREEPNDRTPSIVVPADSKQMMTDVRHLARLATLQYPDWATAVVNARDAGLGRI
jgi:hypothetical protein